MTDPAPDILLITCDQLRADALGCYGNPLSITPNIDSLAAQGTVYTQCHVASPVCSPNRASIATGMYPSAHGLATNGVVLPPDTPTMMSRLRERGYETALAGKLHFRPQWNFPPGDPRALAKAQRHECAINPEPMPWEYPYYGFDKTAIVEDHPLGAYADFLTSHGFDPWKDPHSATYPQHYAGRSAYPASCSKTTWVTDRSLEMIDANSGDKPLFLWTSYVAPHHPFVAPAPFDEMFSEAEIPEPVWDPSIVERWPLRLSRKYTASNGSHEAVGMSHLTSDDFRKIKAHYYGMVAHVDEQIGRLFEKLAERRAKRNVIVVFTSDHGELLGDYHLLFKATHYRCVTNVPLVIANFGAGNRPSTSSALVSSIDLMPTLLEYAGISPGDRLQGKSFKDLAHGNGSESSFRTELLIEDPSNLRTLVSHSRRLSFHGPGEVGELYNLEEDPDELVNLWKEPSSRGEKEHLLEHLLHLCTVETALRQDRKCMF